MANAKYIRNFCIIAHVDHGKSTLADRLIEYTGGLQAREMTEQVLDTLELERERGITIKAQSITLEYTDKEGGTYMLNLIDTPGHVDFSYEVSRSLAACEGALLLVDASQGVEAQTVANAWLAIEQNLEIIPILNKVDLPNADIERVSKEIETVVGISADNILQVSAKQGIGVQDVLEAIIKHIPPPANDIDQPLQALVYDAWFDNYLGVVVNLRVRSGKMQQGDHIRFMATGANFEVATLSKRLPYPHAVKSLQAGEVGQLSAAIKDIHLAPVGDTITSEKTPAESPLAGYTRLKPMVFSGLYPSSGEDFERLKDALEKLALNDAALQFEPESSAALGFGYRCKFLGMLHMEIVQERLEREMHINLITTAPTVVYQVNLKNGKQVMLENPSQLPMATLVESIAEPYVKGSVFCPSHAVGNVMRVALERRGLQRSMRYIDEQRVVLEFELPLAEVIVDFYDRLKSVTKGYGSFDYEMEGFRVSPLVKLDLLLNGEKVDALSMIVPREKAQQNGRALALKLKKHIPRQMFEVAIQAAIGSKIIARESISAIRKNVTAKCYGGDITRKRKLLEKQKEGKKRMKQIGSVEVPQEAFMSVLRRN